MGSIQFTQLDQATQQQFSGVQTVEASPGFVSNSPIISAFSPSTPAWARGMAIEAVGPFEEQITSVLSWVQILIPLPRKVNVKYGISSRSRDNAFGRAGGRQDQSAARLREAYGSPHNCSRLLVLLPHGPDFW